MDSKSPQEIQLLSKSRKVSFLQDKIKFLGFVVFTDRIQMEEKRIDTIKKWPKLKSVQDIQVFIGFANFYWRFIFGFSKIVALLIIILKTTGSSVISLNDDEVISSRADGGNIGSVVGLGALKGKTAKSKSQNPKSGNLVNSINSEATEKLKFLTSKTRKAFNHLKQVFTKAPIFRYFNPEYHIRIKSDILGYVIGKSLNQLISN